jgi:hypothetical protein
MIDAFVPKKIITRQKYPVWFSFEHKNLIFKNKIAYKIFKNSDAINDYNKFSNLRAQCKSLSKLNYQNYLKKIQEDFKHQSSKFWKFINEKCKKTFLPDCMYLNDSKFYPPNSIVEAFAQHFATVYEYYDNSKYIDLSAVSQNNSFLAPLFSRQITLIEIFNALNNLSLKNGPGPDLITR